MIAPADGFPGGFIMGANLAMTADAVARVGPFDERFGAGARFISAEDTDFLFRALGQGIAVRYDPRFAVDHYHGRRCPAEVVRLLAGYSYGDGALYAKHLLKDFRILKAVYQDIINIIKNYNDPVLLHRGINNFYYFVFAHKFRGFLSYVRCL